MQIGLNPQGQRDRALIAELLTFLVFLAALLVRLLTWHTRSPIDWGLHPYLVDFVQSGGNHNYLGQRSAHLATVAITFALVLVARFAPRLNFEPLRRVAKQFSFLSAAFLIAFFCASISFVVKQALPSIIFTASCGAACFLGVRTGGFKKLAPYLTVLLAGLFLAAMVPGLFKPLDLSLQPQASIAEIQSNYSLVVTQGDRLANGERLFIDVKSFYGFLLPVLCGIWQRQFGELTWGNYVSVIKLMQIAFMLAVVLLFRFHSKKISIGFILAVLMVLPWYHTMQESLLFPNLSPWRLLSFPLSLLVLFGCRRKTAALTAFLLGSALALFLFVNVESSVAVAAGYLIFFIFRFGNIGIARFVQYVFFGVLGMSVSLIGFALMVKFGLGYFPDLTMFIKSRVEVSALVQTGWWGGFPLIFVPFAVLCCTHQLYALLKLANGGASSSSFSNSFRASVMFMSLTWFAYYVNRPAPWYLHGQYFLYGFALIDLVRTLTVKRGLRRTQSFANFEKPIVLFACLYLVVLPCMIQSFETALPWYSAAFRKPPKDSRLVSGVVLPAVIAEEAKTKSKFVKELSGSHKLIYLTSETLLVPKLSGVHSAIPFDDSYVELAYVKNTDDFVESLCHGNVHKILLDDLDHSVLVGDKDRVKWQQDMFSRLSKTFARNEHRKGWIILERNDVPFSIKKNEPGYP